MTPRHALVVLSLSVTIAYGSALVKSQNRDAAEGAQRFMEYCAGCHGADGRGGDKTPSLVASPDLPAQSDGELIRIVHDGTTGGMPPFAQIGDANIEAVVHYLRLLHNDSATTTTSSEATFAGDASAGRELYFGKAQCSTCHLMQGKGGFIAHSLTDYGRRSAPEAIRHAITNPDDPLVSSSQLVTVTTGAGESLSGVLRNEDNFTMAIQTEDGRYHLFAKSDLENVRYSGQSLMPRDYAKRLTPKELDDLVSFIMAAGKASHIDLIQSR
jgi:cytochrome c oxidase cbb3-type subunit 3